MTSLEETFKYLCYLWPFVLSEAVVETEVLLYSAVEVPLERA